MYELYMYGSSMYGTFVYGPSMYGPSIYESGLPSIATRKQLSRDLIHSVN